jgi:hypothetical protein
LWTYTFINKLILETKDAFIKKKYESYIKDNEINLCSDIFHRLDIDRKLKDELKRLQRLSEMTGEEVPIEEFLQRKKQVQKEILPDPLQPFRKTTNKKQKLKIPLELTLSSADP